MRSSWRWARFALVLAMLAVALPSPDVTRVVLPALAEGEYYSLIGDGYAARSSIHDDAVGVLDLYNGRELWRRDPGIGHLQSLRIVDGVLIMSALQYSDATREILKSGTDQTIAVDLRSGGELWRRKGAVLSNTIGAIVPIWCNGCSDDAVGADARTGREIWRSPWLKSSNYFDGRSQWSTARDGTVRAVDLATGRARLVGTLPQGYWIIGGSARYILAVPPSVPDSGPIVYPGVGVFDSHDLRQIAHLNITNSASFPPDLWLCGDLICQRGGVEMKVYDLHGEILYSKAQFLLHTVVDRGDRQFIIGEQHRSGVVTPGVPMDTNQIVETATGHVLADIGVWRLVRVDADRIWVAQFASRGTATLVVASHARAQHETIFGYIDLRSGVPLAVTTLRRLGGAYEDCDFSYGWLLCSNDVTDIRPVAIRLDDRPV
ncbi:PQQ-binding-like beta-propeller repeat protein [Hamadaea tsunoensis]|uniref:hypothetical protein n=1 Tax=Hamadaea tsunoensis TaxID=53368 RepID=UPI0004832585|nr:hypothetical protein [Hamadaea tsunoensis]